MKKILILPLLFTVCIVHAQCEDFMQTISIYHPTCHGFTDGFLNVSLEGGTAPYMDVLTNEDGEVLEGTGGLWNLLGGGFYYLVIEDSEGCTLYDTIEIIDPPEMMRDLILTEPTPPTWCDGIANVDTVYNYAGSYESISYLWSPIDVGGVGESLQTDLCTGDYTVAIIDENGCIITEDFSLGNVGIEAEQFNTFPVSIQVQNQAMLIRNSTKSVLQIKLFSLSGSVVFESNISAGQQLISPAYSPGLYLYQLVDGKEVVQSGKLSF